MKFILPLLLILLVAVGCATTPTKKSVAGTYEVRFNDEIEDGKLVILENGTLFMVDEEEEAKATWKFVGKELHFQYEVEKDDKSFLDFSGKWTWVLKIESNGDLTAVYLTVDEKPWEIEKGKNITFKKIK